MNLFYNLKIPSCGVGYSLLYDLNKYYDGALVEQLLDDRRISPLAPSHSGYRKRFERNLQQFVFNSMLVRQRENLIRSHTEFAPIYLAVPLKGVIRKPSRYRPSHISYKYVRALLDTLSDIGWIDHRIGNNHVGDVTLFRPVGDFARLIDDHLEDVPGNVEFGLPPELVVVKDKDDRLVDYEDDATSCELRSELESYDQRLEQHQFSLSIPTSTIKVTTTLEDLKSTPLFGLEPQVAAEHLSYSLNDWHTTARRVFNRSSWKRGGRYYSPVQNLPVGMRRWLRIDDEPVTEVDYDSLHPAMLYNLAGQPLRHDPYDVGLGKEARRAAKRIMLIFVNAKNHQAAYQAVEKESWVGGLDLLGIEAKEYVRRLKSRNQVIAHHFHSDKGIELQRYDAEIAHRITDRISPCLVVHDSFIVKRSQQQELIEIMKEEYERVFKFDIEVSVEY